MVCKWSGSSTIAAISKGRWLCTDLMAFFRHSLARSLVSIGFLRSVTNVKKYWPPGTKKRLYRPKCDLRKINFTLTNFESIIASTRSGIQSFIEFRLFLCSKPTVRPGEVMISTRSWDVRNIFHRGYSLNAIVGGTPRSREGDAMGFAVIRMNDVANRRRSRFF